LIKKITDKENLIAIVGSLQDIAYGNNFITEPELPMQLGLMRLNKGKIENHIHKIRNRQVKSISNEFHMVITGKAILSLFNASKNLVTKTTLCPGMFCMLFNGGHGYEIIKDDTVIVEVKNGAFTSVDEDKEKF
jgi:hypothetical protein